MLKAASHPASPRFHVPNWIARPLIGNRLYMTLPTSSLVHEVQFRGIKSLHKPAMKRFLCSGDLAQYLVPVSDSNAAREISQLIKVDLDYKKTDIYQSVLGVVEKGLEKKFHARHLRTSRDVDEYFEYQVKLIRSIMTHGYVSQKKLTERHREQVPEYSPIRPTEHEIGCAIGPDGETWMFRTGHHRLQIARNLGIERIPVEVHFVHWKWIVKCLRNHRRAPLPIIFDGAKFSVDWRN